MPRFAMDKTAYGVAAIGVLESVALLAFAVFSATGNSGAAPPRATAGMPTTAMARTVSFTPGHGEFAGHDARAAAPAGLSICADVHTGFICAP